MPWGGTLAMTVTWLQFKELWLWTESSFRFALSNWWEWSESIYRWIKTGHKFMTVKVMRPQKFIVSIHK